MAPRKAEVLEAVRAAIHESTNARQKGHSRNNIFVKTYGPGLAGITNGVREGRFFVHAARFSRSKSHETVITVSFVPETRVNPLTAEQLDPLTLAIVEAVEAEFHRAGATLDLEGYDSNRTEPPWRWFMTWVWDHRD